MLTQFIADHGYWAVFAGSVLEGETVLVLGGFAAHQGYLSFLLVVACGAGGGAAGDLLFFFLGRRHGGALLERFPQWQPRARQVNCWLMRYQAGMIIGVRFMYGLRAAGPIAIGMSDIPAWRFLLFNLIGAALWATLIAAAGYLFGQTLQWLFTDIKRYEEAALLLIAAAAVVLALIRQLRKHS